MTAQTRRTILLLGSLILIAGLDGIAQAPPAAPIRTITDFQFGVKVEDPYRYMENLADPDVATWMKAQSTYARGVLDRIPGRAALLARMDEITRERANAQGGAVLADVRRLPGDLYFYLKTQPPRDQTGKLYMRRGIDGPEVLLVDPDLATRATGKPHTIDGYVPSFDGKHVAYGLAASGSEDAVLHVIDTSTRNEVGDPIDRWFNGLDWRPDGRSFFYLRRRKTTAGMPPSELRQRIQVFLHTLGRDSEDDPLVFGIDAPPLGGRINPPDIPRVITTPGSRWAVGMVRDNNEGALSLYAAPVDTVGMANTPWRRVCDVEDGVEMRTGFVVRGEELFVITHQAAPRRRVARLSLATGNCRSATSVVPADNAVVETLAAASDAVYVVRRDGPVEELLRVTVDEGGRLQSPRAISLPVANSIRLMPLDPRVDGALVALGGPLQPLRLYAYAPRVGRIAVSGLLPRGDGISGRDELEVVYAKVASHDGVLVPLSIVYKRGVKRSGSNPTILEGYGAYGTSTNLDLRPPLRAWCELGGIYVIAHVRGGGEYGEEWHRGGYKATKPNTWKDVIAAAEYLVAEKYTSPARLAIRGASAGGILVGRAITERPDLFAVALPSVGLLDLLRFETEANGVPNIPEFGSAATEEGFTGLLAMSSYHHVRDGTRYPAVLLQAGLNDPRVSPWHSAKMAARLQAATASGRPVLLSVDDDGGHGVLASSLRSQRQGNNADAMAFAMWQFGVSAFQPSRPSR